MIIAYKATPQNAKMPAINCGTDDRPMWYLPEKLQILPYQLYKRKVPDGLTSDMLLVVCNHPDVSRALIEHEVRSPCTKWMRDNY